MLILRILIKKDYFCIFIHIYFLVIDGFNIQYLIAYIIDIENHWRLHIETNDIFLRLFPHSTSLVEKNGANSGAAYTSKGRRRTNCATFLKLPRERGRNEGVQRKSNEWRARRVDTDDRGKCEENFSQDEETRDAIFCSKQLIHPRSFFFFPPVPFFPCCWRLHACPVHYRAVRILYFVSPRPFLWLFATPRDVLYQRLKVEGNISMSRFRNESREGAKPTREYMSENEKIYYEDIKINLQFFLRG